MVPLRHEVCGGGHHLTLEGEVGGEGGLVGRRALRRVWGRLFDGGGAQGGGVRGGDGGGIDGVCFRDGGHGGVGGGGEAGAALGVHSLVHGGGWGPRGLWVAELSSWSLCLVDLLEF